MGEGEVWWQGPVKEEKQALGHNFSICVLVEEEEENWEDDVNE